MTIRNIISFTSSSLQRYKNSQLKHLNPWHNTKTISFSTTSQHTALELLNLAHNPQFSVKELRHAYFAAAKRCHPDSNDAKASKIDTTDQFLQLTEAYELLQEERISFHNDDDDRKDDMRYSDIVSKTEEQIFREACREHLGLDAETVEESKRCPLFREWLKGRTDASNVWNIFFMRYGGLAPMLRRKEVLKISNGNKDPGKRRRRR